MKNNHRKQAKTSHSKSKPKNSVPQEKAPLINSLVMTVRSPSKNVEVLCKQLKKILSPDCLNKLDLNPKIKDVIDVSDQLLVKQVIHISGKELKIARMPKGPTYTFSILEYVDNFKNYPIDLYKSPAFITFDGKCDYKHIFEGFGKKSAGFQRVLHFHIIDDVIHIRHFCSSTEDLDDKFKVCLKEIGPRLSLKLKDIKDGVFSELNIKKTRFYRTQAQDHAN